ncbi:hypothetical protein BDB01DRAFT_800056 [Pilobolus umbonatus]|nr:hypothetical protein BDB01DRAFT_800056 [Pilobolus umbonatus]
MHASALMIKALIYCWLPSLHSIFMLLYSLLSHYAYIITSIVSQSRQTQWHSKVKDLLLLWLLFFIPFSLEDSVGLIRN